MHPSKSKFWYILAAILILPALLINLDMMALNDDEAIRTLVAMEMDYSDNFIVPTNNGANYRSKPPLYNWLLHGSFSILGVNEWSSRFPNILFLGLFGYLIFFYSKNHFSKEYSVLNALMFITCGRILFWDSMLAYIDILYSLFTFWTFMIIYHKHNKQQYWQLFIISYALSAAGFLLKGFPTILFQGLTLLTFFVYKKDFKKLFSLQHLAGLGVFLMITGSYYLAYFNQAELDQTLNSLLDQATRRTSIHEQYDYIEFFKHLVSYPFENIYHFLPWTIMVVYLFGRESFKKITKHPFLMFCSLTFLVNIIVYWVSVEVYPRYILMMMPLVFSILLYLHKVHYDKESHLYNFYFRFSQVLLGFLVITSFIAFYQTLHVDIPFRYLKMGFGIVSITWIAYYFSKYKHIRIISFICVLLVTRIVFNWFFIPEREQGDHGVICKEQAIALGQEYQFSKINVYKGSNIDRTSSVYISRETKKVLKREDFILKDGVTILDTSRYEIPNGVNILGTICVREGQQTLFLVQKN